MANSENIHTSVSQYLVTSPVSWKKSWHLSGIFAITLLMSVWDSSSHMTGNTSRKCCRVLRYGTWLFRFCYTESHLLWIGLRFGDLGGSCNDWVRSFSISYSALLEWWLVKMSSRKPNASPMAAWNSVTVGTLISLWYTEALVLPGQTHKEVRSLKHTHAQIRTNQC